MDKSHSVIQVLQVIPNLPGFKCGYIRFLGKETGLIKYLAFPSDRHTLQTNFDAACVSSLLNGDWNIGTFSNKNENGEVIITNTEKISRPGSGLMAST